jgi:hypothetical protein
MVVNRRRALFAFIHVHGGEFFKISIISNYTVFNLISSKFFTGRMWPEGRVLCRPNVDDVN